MKNEWIQVFIIISVFVAMFCYNIFVVNYNTIKNNWNDYKCNPLVMPFASSFGVDPVSNFSGCIQSATKDVMNTLLEPVEYTVGSVTQMSGQIGNSLQQARGMLSNIRTFFTSIFKRLFSVFLNVILEMQKMIISIKDLVGKLVGIMATILYMMQGSVMAMQSMWKGPPGKLIRGLCFHPSTIIRLEDGSVDSIGNLVPDTTLHSGAKVIATMKISTRSLRNKPQMYCFPASGPDNTNIYVTGCHLVQQGNSFIQVQLHPDATASPKMDSEDLCCLITDTHEIMVGSHVFGDWEDEGLLPEEIDHVPKQNMVFD